MRPMKILVIPSFWPQSTKPIKGIFFKEQVLALQKSGLNVDVTFLEPRSIREFSIRKVRENHFQITEDNEEGIFVMRQRGWNTNIVSALGGLINVYLSYMLVRVYMRQYGHPDLIHAHNSVWAGSVAALVKQKTGIPYVITEHSSAFLEGNIALNLVPYIKNAYEKADNILAVSQSLATAMTGFIGKKTVTVVPNMVDTDFFTPNPFPSDHNSFVFLAIASLIPNKGIDILINAFAQAFGNATEVVLHIAGEGPQIDHLRALCIKLGLDGKVRFLGRLSREEVRAAMWEANALVVSSFHETFGIVIIEALSTGIPVIATRCGGPESIVTPEVGFLVNAGDQESLCIAMRKLRQTSFSKQLIRDYVVSHFSKNVVTKSLTKIYQDIVSVCKS